MRLIIGISGASGVLMGYRMLLVLKSIGGIETHLVLSEGAVKNFQCETEISRREVEALADVVHDNKNMAALISSGSFVTDGMIVIPCSMKTLSGIAHGYASNLLLRAADVCLKEGRKVVVVPREMPFGKVHLKNMLEAKDNGCIIVPPMLTFYNGAESLEEQMDHVIGKVLMQMGIKYDKFVPWKEPV